MKDKKISARIGVIMGSQSDWVPMKNSVDIIDSFNIPYQLNIVSAHRTPQRLYEYAKGAEKKGIKVIVAGAGGAAHLPGMVASLTTLPVLGVPIQSKAMKGMDSLLSIVPVGTLAIGVSGATNAGLLALQILSINDEVLSKKLKNYRNKQTASVLEKPET